MSDRIIVVTGCDANHHDLAEDLLASLRDLPGEPVATGFIQLGAAELPAAIGERADHIHHVDDGAFRERPRLGYALGFLAVKARLPDMFPGFDTYIWLDADTWVQDGAALANLAQAARHADIALVPECDVRYFQIATPIRRNAANYFSLLPAAELETLLRQPMVNAGVFAARAASPVWARWGEVMTQIREARHAAPEAHFSDQIPLHYLIARGEISVAPLSALDNWQVWAVVPRLDLAGRRLVSPFWPFEPLRIVHLAGDTKNAVFPAEGGAVTSYRYRALKALFGNPAAAGQVS